MNLEQKVMGDLKEAMLSRNEKAMRSLRAIKAAIILAKTEEGAGGAISEEAEIKLLKNSSSRERNRWTFIKNKPGRSCSKNRKKLK
jgi:uncharacterized protein YqeY